MDKYFLSQKSLTPSPVSHQGTGSNPQRSQFTFKKNKRPPGPVNTDIDDKSLRQISELSIYNALFSTRSQNPKQDFSSVEINEEDPINDESEQVSHNASENKQFRGSNARSTAQTSIRKVPNERTSRTPGAPSFGAPSFQERNQRAYRQPPQMYQHYEDDQLNEDYGMNVSDKLNINPNQSVAYTGAMRALQSKIRHLEGKLHQVVNQNNELKQLLQIETEKAEQIEQEYEEYKSVEAQINQQLESMETESKKLAEALENEQHERQTLEASLMRLKEENISLFDENKTANKQIKDNSKLLQELIAKEQHAQNELKMSVEALERENKGLQKKNEELQARCEKLESELTETKKIYKDHLQELVVKNEMLTHQLESSKEFYGNQIQDFQRELMNIEEINGAKLQEVEKDKAVLDEKLREAEQVLEAKNREIEELKQSLSRFMNHVLENEKAARQSMDYSPEHQLDSPAQLRFSKTPHRGGPQQEQQSMGGLNRISVPRFSTTTRKNLQFNANSAFEPTEESSEQFNAAPPLSTRSMQVRNDQNYASGASRNYSGLEQSLKNQYDYGFAEKPEGQYRNPLQIHKSSSVRQLNQMVGAAKGYHTERPYFEQQPTYERLASDREGMGNRPTKPNLYESRIDDNRSGIYQSGVGSKDLEYSDRNSLQMNVGTPSTHLMRSLSFGKKESEGQAQRDLFIQAGFELEKDQNWASRSKQGMQKQNSQGNLNPRSNQGNNQEYLSIIENIVATEKEIENLNLEYKETLEKAQVI